MDVAILLMINLIKYVFLREDVRLNVVKLIKGANESKALPKYIS